MTPAAKMSPDTLTAVLNRSTNQSMATMTAYMPVTGRLIELQIITIKTRDAEGIGVTPIDARVERRTRMTY